MAAHAGRRHPLASRLVDVKGIAFTARHGNGQNGLSPMPALGGSERLPAEFNGDWESADWLHDGNWIAAGPRSSAIYAPGSGVPLPEQTEERSELVKQYPGTGHKSAVTRRVSSAVSSTASRVTCPWLGSCGWITITLKALSTGRLSLRPIQVSRSLTRDSDAFAFVELIPGRWSGPVGFKVRLKPMMAMNWPVILWCGTLALAGQSVYKDIPRDYLKEADSVPEFWVGSVDEVHRFLDERVRKGSVSQYGTTAGGRPMRSVVYGQPRSAKGTTTFSGSLGFGDVREYFGPDHARKVYMAIGSVHGGEIEGIMGLVNLIAVLETGSDLRGKPWPGITAAAAKLDRIILIPITNVDGRARVPFRMLRSWGRDATVQEYFNTGGWKDGKLIGWPTCKQYIPLDFSKTGFPGGYPNDAGVNIQHDDFFGHPQPETRALFEITARERPDLILNMHTGGAFTTLLREFVEPSLTPAFEELYRRVHTALTLAKLRPSDDVTGESDSSRVKLSPFNLSTALNLNSGALAVLIESPSHAASTAVRNGKPFTHTPADILDAQLTCHRESMKFLAETGGRSRWTIH